MRRLLKKPLRAALVATVLLAGLLSGAAGATEHDIEFRGCRTIGGNIIKVTRSDEPDRLCRPWQPVVTWSQTGPVGPPGPAGADGADGAAGADGAPGADGADGVSGYVRTAISSFPPIPISAGGHYAFAVSCPAGTNVVGGGGSIDTPGLVPGWALQESYPISDTEWHVDWLATVDSPVVNFTAWALCAVVAP